MNTALAMHSLTAQSLFLEMQARDCAKRLSVGSLGWLGYMEEPRNQLQDHLFTAHNILVGLGSV